MGVVELVRSLTERGKEEREVKDVMLVVSALLHEQYILSLKEEIAQRCAHCHQHPSREMHLLKAIRPFLREGMRAHMDRVIETMSKVDAARSIHRDVRDRDHCEHGNHRGHNDFYERGGGGFARDIYEIDVKCKRKKDIGKWVLGGAALWWLCRR